MTSLVAGLPHMFAEKDITVIQWLTERLDNVESWVLDAWDSPVGKSVLIFILVCVVGCLLVLTWVKVGPAKLARGSGRAVATLVAAGGAWVAADLLGSEKPVYASATAVVCVQLGLTFSARGAISVVMSTFAGLVCAQIVLHLGAAGVFAVLVAAGVSLLVARVSGASTDQAATASAVAVFSAALGVGGLTDAVMVDRMVDTILGACVGVVVSAIPWWGSPVATATREVRALSGQLAILWEDMADLMCAGVPHDDAQNLLAKSRQLLDMRANIAELVEAGLGHARWSPASAAPERVGSLAAQFTLVDHGLGQANAAARALFDASGTVAATKISSDGSLVSATRATSVLFRSVAAGRGGYGSVADVASKVHQDVSAAASAIRQTDDTGVLILGGQLLASASQAADAVQRSEAVQSDIPTVSDVVPPVLLTPVKVPHRRKNSER